MHTPNASLVKCVASFSFLLLSLSSILIVLWVYPPQKEYHWSQWFQRAPAGKSKSAIFVPGKDQPAEVAAIPRSTSPVVVDHLSSAEDSTPSHGPARATGATAGSSDTTVASSSAVPTQFKEELDAAMKLVDTGKPAEAVPILTKILEKEPNNEMALVELAMIQLLDFKDPAASVPLLERALRVNPGNQVVMAEMLGAYEEMGQGEAGMAIVEKMYEEQPQNRELAFGIGKSHADMGDYAKALPYLADAAKDSKNLVALEQYGRAMAATGSPDEAMDIYRSIVDKEVENQKNGVYAGEPDQGKEKIALARMTVAHALMAQEGVDNKEAIQEQLAEIEKTVPTEEAKAELFEKFRRKNMH
jgi:tetratricopeptide (TPR) repeat protein